MISDLVSTFKSCNNLFFIYIYTINHELLLKCKAYGKSIYLYRRKN